MKNEKKTTSQCSNSQGSQEQVCIVGQATQSSVPPFHREKQCHSCSTSKHLMSKVGAICAHLAKQVIYKVQLCNVGDCTPFVNFIYWCLRYLTITRANCAVLCRQYMVRVYMTFIHNTE